MIFAFILLFFLPAQEEAPFKPKEDFEVRFDLSFKQRVSNDKAVYVQETRAEYEKRHPVTPLPFLKFTVKINRVQPEEAKVKVVRDDKTTLQTRKIEQNMEVKFEAGFTDDIKDRVSGYKHVIQFLSAQKEVLSRIVIEFDKEGHYFVNGEKRGKV